MGDVEQLTVLVFLNHLRQGVVHVLAGITVEDVA